MLVSIIGALIGVTVKLLKEIETSRHRVVSLMNAEDMKTEDRLRHEMAAMDQRFYRDLAALREDVRQHRKGEDD